MTSRRVRFPMTVANVHLDECAQTLKEKGVSTNDIIIWSKVSNYEGIYTCCFFTTCPRYRSNS